MRSADADQNTLSDEDLCRQAALGDRLAEEILAVRYHRLVRLCARPSFLAGGGSAGTFPVGTAGPPAPPCRQNPNPTPPKRSGAKPPGAGSWPP